MTMLPSNSKHVGPIPSNHHVTLHGDENANRLSSFSSNCHCYGDECYCKLDREERNATLNKERRTLHPKFLWDKEKGSKSRPEETALAIDVNSPSDDESHTIDQTYPDQESDKPGGQLHRTSSQHTEKPINGNSNDMLMMPSYNGMFGAKYGYKFPSSEVDSDDTQALDYSMSSCKRQSQDKKSSATASNSEKPAMLSTPLKIEDCSESDDFMSKDCLRRMAYPFLTRELFASKIGTPQPSDLDQYKNELESETRSAIVEEVAPEKSNSLLNDLYLPSVVKSEPCDEYNEMTEMQYMCASRLLRHTELPSSPLQLKFTCKTCGEVFKNRQYRDLHVKLHRNAHKFICTVCGTGFEEEDEYQSHQKLHCEPLLVCQDCGYRCTREFRMKSHREICGQPSKIYKCPFCSKPFAAKRYMNIHMKSHDVRNVNPCPFCPNVYPLKNSLLKHIKKKHGVSKVE